MIERHEAVTRAYEIPGQTWPAELCWLYDNIGNSTTHAESGVYCGRSLFVSVAAMKAGTVYAVDLDAPNVGRLAVPGPAWLRDVQVATFNTIRTANKSVDLQVRRTGSLAVTRELFSAGVRFDSVFIDGFHYYEHVNADIEAWKPLVKPGGLICGHDFWAAHPGVMRAVHEAFDKFDVVPNTRLWWAILP